MLKFLITNKPPLKFIALLILTLSTIALTGCGTLTGIPAHGGSGADIEGGHAHPTLMGDHGVHRAAASQFTRDPFTQPLDQPSVPFRPCDHRTGIGIGTPGQPMGLWRG